MSEIKGTPTEMVVVTAANLRGLTDTLYPMNEETIQADIEKDLSLIQRYISESKFSARTKDILFVTVNKMLETLKSETLKLGLSEPIRIQLYEYSRFLISTSL